MSDRPAGAGPRIEPYGDAAALVIFGDEVDPAISSTVRAATLALDGLRSTHRGLGPAVAAYMSVLVPFDPLVVGFEEVGRLAAEALDDPRLLEEPREPLLVEVPTHYGGEDGPDLAEVAEAHDLTAEQAIELHAAAVYVVAFLGFMPGLPYMLGGPPELDHPRRPTPRTRVPAGSVAIAGLQGTVYPFATPGGWNLVGRTDLGLWDIRRDPPALLAPGSRVRFVPVTRRGGG